MKCTNCNNSAIGYIGLTGTEQKPYCEKCIEEMSENESPFLEQEIILR